MQNTIILLIEQIVVALGGEFKLYLPQLIPHMLRVFMHDNSTGRNVTMKVSASCGQQKSTKLMVLSCFNLKYQTTKKGIVPPKLKFNPCFAHHFVDVGFGHIFYPYDCPRVSWTERILPSVCKW